MMVEPASHRLTETRSLPRARLLLSATISFGNTSGVIRIRDLSATGARIEGMTLPPEGSMARISRGALQASGTIMWRADKECGIRFDGPLPLAEWIPAGPSSEQLAVDARLDAVRSGQADVLPFGPVPPSKAAIGDALPQRLAEELAYVGRLLESLGDDLCTEPLLVVRHAQKLQNLDIAAQILGHVARLLVAKHPEQAIDSIGMTCLRKRLKRVSL